MSGASFRGLSTNLAAGSARSPHRGSCGGGLRAYHGLAAQLGIDTRDLVGVRVLQLREHRLLGVREVLAQEGLGDDLWSAQGHGHTQAGKRGASEQAGQEMRGGAGAATHRQHLRSKQGCKT